MINKNKDKKTKIIQEVKYGNTKTYLIKNEPNCILIDTDWAGTLPMFFRKIKDLGIKLSDIKYLLITHYHPDHME